MAEERLFHSIVADAACAAGRHVVCGRTLKPFCLLHSFQLSQLENKLWTGHEPEPHELSIAAQICASDEPVLDFAEDAAPFDAETELAKWRAYMRLCAASPMMKERITATVTLNDYGAPVELWCAAFLMTKLRIDERRAWRMPYGLAWWYVQTAHEQETGETYILTEAELADMEERSTPEAIAAREEFDVNARWIVENVKDPAARGAMLKLLSEGTLAGDWREEYVLRARDNRRELRATGKRI